MTIVRFRENLRKRAGDGLAVFLGCLFAAGIIFGLEQVYGHLNRVRQNDANEKIRIEIGAPKPPAAFREFEVPNGFAQRPEANPHGEHAKKVARKKQYSSKYFASFQNFAPVPSPGRHRMRSTTEDGTKTLYDAAVEIDDRGFRAVPHETSAQSEHALFFGCSFVFGEGVEGNQTLPYFIEKADPKFLAFNFGFHGYGANDLLARARVNDLQSLVKIKRGVAFYNFIDHHLLRAIGSMRWLASSSPNHPYFFEDSDGALRQDRDFAASRPLWVYFSRLLEKSEILRRYQVDFPPRITIKHMRFYAHIVDRLRAEYDRQLPGNQFYVVMYPGSNLAPWLAAELEKLGIRYLDYSKADLAKYAKGVLEIPGDGHPSPEANRIVADQLVKDLRAYQNRPPSPACPLRLRLKTGLGQAFELSFIFRRSIFMRLARLSTAVGLDDKLLSF